MANINLLLAAAETGLSGHSVRGLADNAPQDGTNTESLGEIVHQAADMAAEALNAGGHILGRAVDVASDKAFAGAANVGANIATPVQTASQNAFSWSGYFQAIGILCFLLAALWFAVWCIRRYGKFNFLPRPGALPRDSLVMEAQMPLGPRKGLMVVRFLNRRLLLGVTEHQISLITEEDAENVRPANDFQDVMDKVRNSGPHGGANHNSA